MNTIDRRTLLKTGGGALLAGAAAPWLLAAGGSSDPSGSTSRSAPITLEMWTDKPTQQAWYQEQGQQAKAAVGVGWKPTSYSSDAIYQPAVKTAAASSKTPDLFTWWPSWQLKDLVDAGFVANIDAQFNKQGKAYTKDVRNLFSFNGKTYGAPLSISPWVCLYNKHTFAKYSLQPPKTWSDLQQVMSTLKSNGVTPLAATVDGVWSFTGFQTLMVASNPTLYQQLMAGKKKWTDPGVVNVMKLWAQMLQSGDFTNPSSVTFSTRGTNVTTPFQQGKVAMVQMGTWFESNFTAAGMKPDLDYGAFLFPMMKSSTKPTVVLETSSLCVAEHGKHKADAAKALGWFMSKKGQQAWVKRTAFISARSDVAATTPVDQKIMQDIKSGGYQEVNRFYEATPNDIVLAANDGFQKFLLHPGDPMPILETIQSQADPVWQSMK